MLSRAFQIFAPGIPQVYYVGLLAGENNIKLLESSKEGRNINRHYYFREEIQTVVQRPVAKNLFKLLQWRNTSHAFDLNGSIISVEQNLDNHKIKIVRQDKDRQNTAILEADAQEKKFLITENGKEIFKNY
ncbi:MAG: hypothetical protein PR2021_4480 [Candidatus Phytoplasma pruni]|nr:hypothetical protein [Poinsettia branch-inducing phytoplasma]WEK82514.1 MAG: hypothetical protein PR2021_4480 [Candidatus Phytoplasma pruni]